MASQATFQDIGDAIDHSKLNKPSAGLRGFLASLPKARRASDRRQTDRYSVIADVIVVPLDTDLLPAARPFIACSRDVSTGGMCLYHSEPVESTLLYVEIASPDAPGMSALMKVLRQKRVGGYFEIAGQFLSDCPPNAANDDPHQLAPESERHRATS
jgi:hypothetical protein